MGTNRRLIHWRHSIALIRPRIANRWLVFVQAGKSFNRRYVYKPRKFDLLVNYFEPPEVEPSPNFDIVIFQRGTKTGAINTLLKLRPDLLLRYDAVLFLDDDIELSASAIENLFHTMERQDLALAQASLSADSDCVWPVFKQPNVGERVRLVNAVEVMMPALTRQAPDLRRLGVGRGDQRLRRRSPDRQGVFGRLRRACRMVGTSVGVHERKIDDKGGAYYNYMRQNGINPKFELWRIIQKYSIVPDFYYLDK